jgi:hypothetical protein
MTTMTMTIMVAESNSGSIGGDGDSNGWGGDIGSKGNSDCSGNDSNDGNNGGSFDKSFLQVAVEC